VNNGCRRAGVDAPGKATMPARAAPSGSRSNPGDGHPGSSTSRIRTPPSIAGLAADHPGSRYRQTG
jgi:hypothetical protein